MAVEGASRDALGIVLQLVATFLAALAYVLQKKAHANKALKQSTTSIFRHPLWLAGFLAMVVTSLLDVYSFSLMDQSKLAAFGAVTMAWNVVLSALVLKERFTRVDGAAVAVISSGTVLALWAAAADSKDFTFQEILDLLNDDAVYAYSILVGGTVIASALYIDKIAKLPAPTWTPMQSRVIAIGSPIVGGACTGFTCYAGKAISAAIFHADWDQLAAAPFYVYLAIAAVSVSGQVRYLNTGLRFFDAMSTVPVFQGAIIMSNSLAGIVYYRDLREESAGRKFAFAVGALATIAGVNILLLKARKSAAYNVAVDEPAAEEGGGKVKPSESVADLAAAVASPREAGDDGAPDVAGGSTPVPLYAFGSKPTMAEGAGTALVSALQTTLSASFVQIARSASVPSGRHHSRVASSDKEDGPSAVSSSSSAGGGDGGVGTPGEVELVSPPRSTGVISRSRTISSGAGLSLAPGGASSGEGRKPSLSLGHAFSLRDVKVHGALLEPAGGEETPEPDASR